MINKQTVFILGAGASHHYGYPTGEKLIEMVIAKARELSNYCAHRVQSGQVFQSLPIYVDKIYDKNRGTGGAVEAWVTVHSQCEQLINRIRVVRPLVIDYFLAWNDSLRPIGKLMIAAVILECETRSRLDYRHVKDDWYRFLVHKIVSGCATSQDIFNNNVYFVTFNYDTSLEYNLYRALTSLDIFDHKDVAKFLDGDRIVHVYGALGRDNYKDEETQSDRQKLAPSLGDAFADPLNHEREFETRKEFLDKCLLASQSLRIIDPHEKGLNDAELALAKKWIADARVVYILGYGFDVNNNQRLALDDALKFTALPTKEIMFTNFEDRNTINKKVSQLFFGNRGRFLHDDPIVSIPEGYYAEKSVRNVYEALEMDFDSLEEARLRSTNI